METQTPGPAQLLKLAGDDDTAAFAALYDLTSPQVYGMLTVLFPIEHDAMQATTDAYTSLWRQAPHFTFVFIVDHADEQAPMLTVLFPIDHHDIQATTPAYTSLWRQPPHSTFDFNVHHADEQARDRTVVAWINSIAQQIGRYHRPDAQDVGDVDRMQAVASRL